MRANAENFVKTVKTSRPEGQICVQNSKFWQFWGLFSYISAPMDMTFDKGANLQFAPPCQISRLSGQRVASAGWKDHRVKTIPASLPVIIFSVK